ncbi:MAG TPA: PrsW family glutamic-type intramembrane protease [Candidatus Limnocylindrales bacterium]|nr:PrsW family glutamic-type intramembrane protease [Candidatus Limnocylindrales bacterium]
MTTLEADGTRAPAGGESSRRADRAATRAIAWIVLVAFIVATANAILFSHQHLLDVRLPMLGLGTLLSSPGWLLLLLAARNRGAPWRWLAVAIAWGLFVAAFLAYIAEDRLQPLMADIGRALMPLGERVAYLGPAAIIAPIVEEPAKAIGVLIVLLAIRRAGTMLTLGLGAALGALTGLAFSLAEISLRMGEMVANVGYIDLDGVFRIDWDNIWNAEQLQLVNRLFLFGLSDHALNSALAGVGLVQLLRGQRGSALGWFVAALACHALINSIGLTVGGWAFDTAMGVLAGPSGGTAALLVAGWLAAVAGFLIGQAWAAIVLRRGTRRTSLPVRASPEPASVMPM